MLNALDAAEADIAALDLIVHGTTTTTNAVLERNLCTTGLITTMGFRDVLELGRRTRPNAYGMKGEFRPIIPRDLRLEIPERMDASGRVLTVLDEDALRAALNALIAVDCEALVIHFLHAYANPAHELRAAEIAREIWPNGNITMGHALLSESREFERGVTAAVNASVQPLLRALCRAAGRPACQPWLQARRAGDERQWRHGFGAVRGQRGGEDSDVRSCFGRHGGRLYRAAGGHSQSHHL